MEIEDIDNKLDMHFEIHFNDWSKITEISRELSYNGEIAIISEEKSIYFYVFSPKMMPINTDTFFRCLMLRKEKIILWHLEG
ncbi:MULTISPECIES: hypothetical protein [unclassified Acidiplasma]|uniref:hypothetical protein n=1 Tax=unclassified Acidiplasma TaxID=2641301 RepID=UPI00064EA7C7|nr:MULTISPECIES: hypothetical protein [unclassified Acidiplasma]WMT55665.1 MAG: hypothetical protein RE470_03220 [Acidiplasma sp.]